MDDIRPGLRRDPPTDLSDVGEDAALLERIRDEIRATGPMPFARFMELALYDARRRLLPRRGGSARARGRLHHGARAPPDLRRRRSRTGRRGGLATPWRTDPFVLHEHGAGDGALGLAVLDGSPRRIAVARRHPLRPGRGRRRAASTALASRLKLAGLDGGSPTPGDDRPIDGIVLANEVLDALPVHRVRRRGDRLREVAVDVGPDGAFVEVEIDPSTPALTERLAEEDIELVDGQTAEICLALDAWIADAAAPLARGVLLLIDYGAPAEALYDPVRRRDGTLRAYVRHQVHDDPYRLVGRQDLTAHVDVTAVERAAHAAGLTTIGITTQAEALMGLGIEARPARSRPIPRRPSRTTPWLRSALMRLLDPAAMGRFRVMAFGRGWPRRTRASSARAVRLPASPPARTQAGPSGTLH